VKLILAALFLAASFPAFSQVVPATKEDHLPLVVGVGFSYFYTEMFSQRVEAPTVWADWSFNHGPSFLHGFGIEAEIRDLDFGQPPYNANFQMFTAGGGPIYTLRHYRNFHPYGKFLVDYGSMNHIKISGFPSWYTRDNWTIYAPGGGIEYRAWRNVWVRADYEYQFWRADFFNTNTFLNPEGFTIGASYDFGHIHAH
jgi:opacity protein-like surface antigen